MGIFLCVYIYIITYTYTIDTECTHTHTHTHIYIYIYIWGFFWKQDFLDEGSSESESCSPGLLHCKQILYRLSRQCQAIWPKLLISHRTRSRQHWTTKHLTHVSASPFLITVLQLSIYPCVHWDFERWDSLPQVTSYLVMERGFYPESFQHLSLYSNLSRPPHP